MFSCVADNLDSVSFLRFLYFKTPAASSKMARRSSGLLLKIDSIFPWEMIESYHDQDRYP
jgi:hypothetical protein